MARNKRHGNNSDDEPFVIMNDWEEDDDSENISVYDAAEIWRDSGFDEDSTFGYSEEELRDALDS